MNYSAASATKHNNNDLTTSPTGIRDDRQFGTHSHSCTMSDSGRDNNNKSLKSFDVDSSNKQQQNIYHQQQQQLCGKIHGDDLRMLIRELKRKVDYTEKMNWMCKYMTYTEQKLETKASMKDFFMKHSSEHESFVVLSLEPFFHRRKLFRFCC